MYRKKLMRACLTGVMIVSIATANVAPVFAAEPADTVQTQKETKGVDFIGAGKINFRDTENEKSIFVDFKDEKIVMDKEHKYYVMSKETVKKYLPKGYELVEGIYSVSGGETQGSYYVYAEVKKIPDTKTVKINYYDEAAEKQIAEVALEAEREATEIALPVIQKYLPTEYVLVSTDYQIRDGYVYVSVTPAPVVEETKTVKINYYDETAGRQAAEVAIEVSKDAAVVDKAILARHLPAGYNFKGTDCVIRDGYVYVAVEAIAAETKEVNLIYTLETGENVANVPVTVGAADTEVHVEVANQNKPEGYELVVTGNGYAIEDNGLVHIVVRKTEAETKNVHLIYFNVENDENISDKVITVGAKDTHVHVENVKKYVPGGWVLARENDFAIDENGNVKIPVRAEVYTKEVHLIYFNVENDENISDAVIKVGKEDEQVHVENVKKYVPAGWELARENDFAIDENNNVKIPIKKATELREAVLHVTFETTDGEVVGTETVTAKGADGLDATFKLGTDFNLPEGYKLSNDRDQVTEITIPFGSTGGHTMVVEKGDLSSIVKIQFVDAENNDEVVAGGDYFVDGDGDGIFHTREITEWVPEGYELQEVGDFQVELYKETPLQLSVTKIKEDKPETPDPEEPNKPEKPETPDPEEPNKPEKPETPDQEKPGKPEKPNKEDNKKDEKKNSPKTGDETNAAAAALPAGVSLAAILAVLVKKFK